MIQHKDQDIILGGKTKGWSRGEKAFAVIVAIAVLLVAFGA